MKTGFLISDKPFTVQFGGSIGTRSFLAGVNKDVTQEMADHWYVRAAGARYVEKLEDAHKSSPTALASVKQARSTWEQAMRESLRAHSTQISLRRDLERLEKEFGVDTRAADKAFEADCKEEIERAERLTKEHADAIREQEAQDAASDLSPAAAERRAAGSEEVANTEMDGAARADAEKAAVETTQTIQAAAGAPISKPDQGATETEKAAAGSDEAANTHPDGRPVTEAEKREEPKPSETRAADAKDAKDGKTEVAEAKAADKPKK